VDRAEPYDLGESSIRGAVKGRATERVTLVRSRSSQRHALARRLRPGGYREPTDLDAVLGAGAHRTHKSRLRIGRSLAHADALGSGSHRRGDRRRWMRGLENYRTLCIPCHLPRLASFAAECAANGVSLCSSNEEYARAGPEVGAGQTSLPGVAPPRRHRVKTHRSAISLRPPLRAGLQRARNGLDGSRHAVSGRTFSNSNGRHPPTTDGRGA
jgi:hypothetical protein